MDSSSSAERVPGFQNTTTGSPPVRGRAQVCMLAREGRPALRRFFRTYRWESVILLWVPLVGAVVGFIARPFIPIYLYSSPLDEDTLTALFQPIVGAISGGVVILLLIAAYTRLRRLEGVEFLSLLCAYTIMSIAVGILGSFILGTLQIANRVGTVGVLLPVVPAWPLSILPATLVLGLLSLAITLWFARKASRLSLRHAYFLVMIGTLAFPVGDGPIRTLVFPGFSLGIGLGISRATEALIFAVLGLAESFLIVLPLALLGVWLLGNFTSRSPTFQRRAIAGLFAYMALLSAVLPAAVILFFEPTVGEIAITAGVMVFGVLVIAALFPLIYMVRVRTQAPTTPDLYVPA